MMNKRYFVLVAALVCCIMSALAQDVTILHMKDGTTRRYTNGVANTTNMAFYEYNRHQVTASQTEISSNGHTFPLDVNQFWEIKGRYLVGNYWQDDIPDNFQALRGVCFGETPGLTVDNCLGKTYVQPYEYGTNLYYVVIGLPSPLGLAFSDASILISDISVNRIVQPLEMGLTYYYRLFAECQVLEGGQQKTEVFYGEEKSFCLPRLMAAFDYYPTPKASREALAAFAAHFPADVTPPTWEELDSLWNVWRATDQGKSIDISADISSATFDDGTGYRLNRIPHEFYTWLTHREIVIDPYEHILDISKIQDPQSTDVLDSVETVIPIIVYPDASWNVPGGKYVRFEPFFTTVNHYVAYRCNEMIPGVQYKLYINYAPETEDGSTLGTEVRTTLSPNGTEPTIIKSQEVSGTEVTSYEYDIRSLAMGMDYKIETRVGSADLRNNRKTRIMRIAEMKLVPVDN